MMARGNGFGPRRDIRLPARARSVSAMAALLAMAAGDLRRRWPDRRGGRAIAGAELAAGVLWSVRWRCWRVACCGAWAGRLGWRSEGGSRGLCVPLAGGAWWRCRAAARSTSHVLTGAGRRQVAAGCGPGSRGSWRWQPGRVVCVAGRWRGYACRWGGRAWHERRQGASETGGSGSRLDWPGGQGSALTGALRGDRNVYAAGGGRRGPARSGDRRGRVCRRVAVAAVVGLAAGDASTRGAGRRLLTGWPGIVAPICGRMSGKVGSGGPTPPGHRLLRHQNRTPNRASPGGSQRPGLAGSGQPDSSLSTWRSRRWHRTLHRQEPTRRRPWGWRTGGAWPANGVTCSFYLP